MYATRNHCAERSIPPSKGEAQHNGTRPRTCQLAQRHTNDESKTAFN